MNGRISTYSIYFSTQGLIVDCLHSFFFIALAYIYKPVLILNSKTFQFGKMSAHKRRRVQEVIWVLQKDEVRARVYQLEFLLESNRKIHLEAQTNTKFDRFFQIEIAS